MSCNTGENSSQAKRYCVTYAGRSKIIPVHATVDADLYDVMKRKISEKFAIDEQFEMHVKLKDFDSLIHVDNNDDDDMDILQEASEIVVKPPSSPVPSASYSGSSTPVASTCTSTPGTNSTPVGGTSTTVAQSERMTCRSKRSLDLSSEVDQSVMSGGNDKVSFLMNITLLTDAAVRST